MVKQIQLVGYDVAEYFLRRYLPPGANEVNQVSLLPVDGIREAVTVVINGQDGRPVLAERADVVGRIFAGRNRFQTEDSKIGRQPVCVQCFGLLRNCLFHKALVKRE